MMPVFDFFPIFRLRSLWEKIRERNYHFPVSALPLLNQMSKMLWKVLIETLNFILHTHMTILGEQKCYSRLRMYEHPP